MDIELGMASAIILPYRYGRISKYAFNMPVTNIITAIVTAYIATGHPCADGLQPRTHHTVALPRCFPLHSVVVINGERFVGDDRTARRFDGRFDIFMASKQEALQWGKQQLTVTIITP